MSPSQPRERRQERALTTRLRALARRGRTAFLAVLLPAFLTACSGTAQMDAVESEAAAPAAGRRLTIVVDLRVTHQRIDGFGASERVWTDPHLSDSPATVVPADAQRAILSKLFRGLGLTRLRPIIDLGVEGANDNADPLTIDAAGFNFSGKLGDAHIDLMRQATPYGLRTFFPAPVYLEKWIRNGGSPEEHAELVLASLLHWRERGLEPPLFSPLNEPHVTGDLPADWFRRMIVALGSRMESAGLETKLVIPDDVNPREAYERAAAVLDDPNARQYVGALAYHIYGGTDGIERMKELAARYDLPLWMTEYTKGSYDSWPDALGWAEKMHELMTEGGVSAIDYLWGFFGSWVESDTMISIDFDDGEYESHSVTPPGYITSQFARFVRPGYLRVQAAPTTGSVLTSAYIGPKRLVVVAINREDADRVVSFSIKGGLLAKPVRVVRTSADEGAKTLASLTPAKRSFVATLRGQSVTTFVVPLA